MKKLAAKQRDKILEANHKHFEESRKPHFHPYNGVCQCGFDFVEKYRDRYIGMGITGCPSCHKSYCE